MNKLIIIWSTILVISSCGNDMRESAKVAESKDYINYDWANNGLWDDGKAEVAKYQATRTVYGKSRSFEYVFVLVKEVFNEEFTVKTDDYSRSDLYDVMKVNKFCRIPTKAYPYHYLTSVFYERGNPDRVHKLTNTSQEWCGNTAKSFIDEGNQYLFEYMSYWDGQGNGQAKVSDEPWFEDQLSYTLRSLKFADGLNFEISLYPSQVSSKVTVPKAEKATIQVKKLGEADMLDVDVSFADNPYKVTVETPSKTTFYWFNGSYPNLLLKMESSDGSSLTITDVERSAYWAVTQ
ncbi:MAG: hypothetical protein JXR10_06110 [Cyclobacteriaceae bacterium]